MPHTTGTFRPEKTYDFTNLDQVNTFNGGLTLQIPLGIRYSSEAMGYGLTLTFNSGKWQTSAASNQCGNNCIRDSRLGPWQNAGAGWAVSLGALLPPTPAFPSWNRTGEYLYVDSLGGEHTLFPTLHGNDADDDGDEAGQLTVYSRDGSFIRVQKSAVSNPFTATVEFQDGSRHFYNRTPGCGWTNATAPWRPARIEDAFGNGISITYTSTQWTLTDAHGRNQLVHFSTATPPATAAMPAVVTSVELLSTTELPSVWTFSYEPKTLAKPWAEGAPADLEAPVLTELRLPDGSTYSFPAVDYTSHGNPQTVELPTGGLIQYVWGVDSPPGIIRPSVECNAPEFAAWKPESNTNDFVRQRTVVDPLTARRVATSSSATTVDNGTTQYCWFVPTQLPGPNCFAGDEFEEWHQVTIAPDGTRTDHYFSVFNTVQGLNGRAPLWGTQLHEYGRPYVRDSARDDPWGTGAYLSTEVRKWLSATSPPPIYPLFATCASLNPADWEPVRRTFVVYENDLNPNEDVMDSQAAVFHTNPRLQRQRTMYLDDCTDPEVESTCAWTEDAHFLFDDFGHFRQKNQTSSFSTNTRQDFTDYNWGMPSRWPLARRWVLGTYTVHTTSESEVAACAAQPGSWEPGTTQLLREDACFDADTGFLEATRIRSNPWDIDPAPTDLVHRSLDLDATADGLVDEEAWYGGDSNPAPTGSLCDAATFAGFTPANRQAHTYDRGVRTSTQWLDASGVAFGPPLLRQEVNPNTGLPAVRHDPADPGDTLETELGYDEMFRLESVQPSAGLGLASEHYAYVRPGLSSSGRFEITQKLCGNGALDCSGSAVLGERRFALDGFGRVHREWHRYGIADSEWDKRFSWYDSEGRRTYTSEWGRDSQTADYGMELLYDFAGRVIETNHQVPPAGSPRFDQTYWAYRGAREVERTTSIGTQIAGSSVTQSNVTTRETYDGFGRLVKVEEASGANLTSLVPTSYHYDVGSRLIGSRTDPNDATPRQQRCWTYDDRGLLHSERHPELGASGQGVTTYSQYDALGNAREKDTGAHVVSFVFDRANRLTTVSEVLAVGSRQLKAFTYADSNAAGNWKLGKVEIANAWNYPPNGANPEPETRLEETFVYGGVGGRKSERTLKFFLGPGALAAFHAPQQDLQVFHHEESYDALGQRVSLSYPQCVVPSRECLTSVAQLPERSQTWIYELGRLRDVPGWTLPHLTRPGVVYHPGGMWAEIRHVNGVTDLQDQDASRRLRPGSLATVRGSQLLWKPGDFGYDTAGNILSIGPSEDGGTDLFAYDGTSRLRASRFFVQQRNPLDTDLLVDGFETGDDSRWNRTQHWETSVDLGYSFDEHGNLLQEDRTGQPPRVHETDGATNRLTSGVYDAAGNQTAHANVTTTFDALNRVVKRLPDGGTPLYFLYTADDERTVTWDPQLGSPAWLRFTLRDFDGKLIRTVNDTSSDTLVADEDFIFRGDQLLAKVGSGDGLAGMHLSLDHLGSVRTTTNGSGTIVARKKYYPFGEEATPFFEQSAIALKYTGHERDAYDPASNGDDRDYMHARYRSPITARFLSVDPVLPLDRTMSNPQGWNRYSYTRGNPLKRVDRDGKLDFHFTLAGKAPEDCDATCLDALKKAYEAQEALRQSLTPAEKKFYQEAFGVDLDNLLKPGVGPTVQLAKGDPGMSDRVGDSNKGRGPLKLNLDLDLFGGGGRLFQAGLLHEAAHYSAAHTSFVLGLRNAFAGFPIDEQTMATRNAALGRYPRDRAFRSYQDGAVGHAAEILQFGDILTLSLTADEE